MTLSRNTKLKSIYPLIDMVSTMYDKRVFDVLKLRRKFSPLLSIGHGKFHNSFSITNRKTDFYCGGSYEYNLDGTVRITIKHSTRFGNAFQFDFNVSTNKEFLQKLIHYNLI
ncbi:hypothetical protein [Flavobacterium cerinum]|uniref:Uncharacterized protein n=1 Tax=Flavobacterium cerinum TaxID=2502784 RepID=A0A3S3SEQ4_9FLAO|nr:hypothetical protein [Flavobacterium cerinum]RWX00410.1 hypothetical protein EPI11_09025 [Flavobacterium cerinum]